MTNQEPYTVLTVRLSPECFPDDDDLCITAGIYIAQELGAHLKNHGHSIPDWLKGGCEEDWGVYFESGKADSQYQYAIGFCPDRDTQTMVVRYERRQGFWRSLLRRCPALDPSDSIHEVMASFGAGFEVSELLTQRQFDSEY